MYQIEISDLKVDVIRKNIKNMHLSVYPPTGKVRIAVPLNVDDDTIKLFAISQLSWIKRNQRQFAHQDRQSKRVFINRESHYFEGRRYLLRVTEIDAPPKVVIKSKTYLDLYIRPTTSIQQRKNIINEWYRYELKNKIPPLIKKWEKIIGIEITGFGIKQMKTKWGSCNIEKKRILLNLELAKKPISSLEYVIVHEMTHILERHHNERFLAYLDKFMPKWKIYREELNRLPLTHKD